MADRDILRVTLSLRRDRTGGWEDEALGNVERQIKLMTEHALEIRRGQRYVEFTIYFHGADGRVHSTYSAMMDLSGRVV